MSKKIKKRITHPETVNAALIQGVWPTERDLDWVMETYVRDVGMLGTIPLREAARVLITIWEAGRPQAIRAKGKRKKRANGYTKR